MEIRAEESRCGEGLSWGTHPATANPPTTSPNNPPIVQNPIGWCGEGKEIQAVGWQG